MISLLLFFLPLLYTQEGCTKEDIEILRPVYEETQRYVSIFTPLQNLQADSCDVKKTGSVPRRVYYTLKLQEFKDKECEFRFVLTNLRPYVNHNRRYFEYTFNSVKNFDMQFISQSGDSDCRKMATEETEDEKYERMKWHYEEVEDRLQEILVQKLKRNGHLVLATRLLEEEYKNKMDNDNASQVELHATKILMKDLEREVALHFKHTYERHRRLAIRMAREKDEDIKKMLNDLFENNRASILEGLRRINHRYMNPLEKQLTEIVTHAASGYINRKFPMLKEIYPDYEKSMEAFFLKIAESPEIVTYAFQALEVVTEKAAIVAFKGVRTLYTTAKNRIEDIISRPVNCGLSTDIYKIRTEYLYPEYEAYFTHVNPSCEALKHHINGFLFTKYTLILDYKYMKCQFVIEKSEEGVYITGEVDKHSKITSCQNMVLGDYCNAFTLVNMASGLNGVI